MNFAEGEDAKRYCIKTKHVAIICAVVVGVGLIVGLSVGLTRSSSSTGDAGQGPAPAPSQVPSPEIPPEDQGVCPASEDESGDWTDFRLPDFISPVHYDLEVKPLLEEDTYTGSVTISINVSAPTRYLWLHLRETRITQLPELKRSSGEQVEVRRCFEYKKQEYVVMEAGEELAASSGEGAYLLTMKFAGWLNGSLVGFYRTTYEENGQIKSIAATDHEPTDARKSFPCFDEPNKKATYTISIVHPKEYQAVSNMPVEKEESVDDKWNRTTFEKSVPMSTYLVCFAVHQFDRVERLSKRGIPLTIYVQPEQKHTAEYAANITKIVFDYFEEYFAMDYALPKLDEIAIPDFGTGAMENWGLITYRETNLLYDPEESASTNQQRVASVVTHELVHQWFGNTVTMDWWEDLWVNEGFASFFEFLGVNQAENEWQMRDQILLEDVFPIQEDDSLMSSHPIVVTVTTPAEITSVFDGISYSKGASILRMLEDWLTPEKFQKGCQIYLEKFKFKNAKTEDFWGALEEASNLPVKEVMDTWTTQMGYPVLDVKDMRNIIQKRFLLDPRANSSEPHSPLGYTWNIPVKWTEDNVSSITVYNRSETGGITLNSSNPAGNVFLKINPDHIGFYRVNYEVPTWEQIATNLSINHTDFSSADRASLIDDAFALARAQLLDYKMALNLTKYLRMEEDFLPWQRVISVITYIISMFEDDKELYPVIEEYFQSQVKPIADLLGWNDVGDHLTKLLRASVLGLACKMGDQEALENATQLFQQWLSGTVRLPVNLRLLVYQYGMQNSGNETSWNYTLDQYQKTSLAQEKEKLLYGLASVKNVTLLSRYLDFLKDPNLIKSQDVFTVIRYISYNSYGKYMAWNWIQLNWEYLVNRYTLNDRNLGRIVTIAEPFNTELQLWQMESFFKKYPDAGAGETPREQVLETVKNNIEWLRQNRDTIRQWFLDLPRNG
ncbi:LOW QUALITY PROTEIN: glutamyl aminopeptidase [Ursus americanus]|uniref:LOW QUALITY PROTEIN: glutamyl aminopeptidase n=1 Tax=Ursus americanus TaxID=9643 RepID=UPI001E67953A|nr:LOW QUALITY PROTEIN: glutamyl aminopeptidase [Ursus americanus]